MSLLLNTLLIALGTILIFEISRVGFFFLRAKRLGRAAKPFSIARAKAEKNILIIGDSTSYGTGAENSSNSMAGRLSRDHPTSSIVNASKNAMSLKILHRELKLLSHLKFDIIYIHIGGIDTLTFTSRETIEKTLKDIMNLTKTMTTKTVLVSMNNVGVAPVFKFPINTLLSNRSRQIRDLFAGVCKNEGVLHIDLFSERSDDLLIRDPKRFYAPDRIHPSDEGYGIWYEKISQHLKKRGRAVPDTADSIYL